MLETLMALPILCLLGLSAIQFGLLMQARQALSFALLEAARAGSADHADPATVRSGLARGLMPWLFGASDVSDYARNLAQSSIELARTEATGRLVLTQLSPHSGSFEDWGEPGRGPSGELLASVTEIPNDNLSVRSTRTQPASGVAGQRGAEPIGQRSGQTLSDANLLSLQLDYAVPLKVPVVGRVLAMAMRTWAGCQPVGPALRFGPLNQLPAPPGTGLTGPAGGAPFQPAAVHACTMYGDPGPGASPSQDLSPSLPVRVTVTVRMQSAARLSGAASTSPAVLPLGATQTSLFGQPATGPVTDDPAARTPAPGGLSGPAGSDPLAGPLRSGSERAPPMAEATASAPADASAVKPPVSPAPDPAVCDAPAAS